MSSSHNKKRNTGLLYEFLIKTISSSLVENDKQRSAKALRIIKQSFKPGTELYREFRLINSLIKTTVSSEAVAASIISEAKNAARSIDFEALDRQKSILIKNINHQLQDENFYDQHVKEYKIFATVQGLVNGWRAKDVDLQRLAEYEDQLVKWLTSHKDEESPQKINENSVGTNRLVLKVMMKKLSEKYDGNLTPDQKSLIKAYAFSTANDDAGTMTKKMQEIREKLLESIESYVSSEDSSLYLHERLMSIKEKLTEGVTKVDDSSISEYMLYAKLVEELTSGGSNG